MNNVKVIYWFNIIELIKMFKNIAIHSFLLTFLLMSCASSGGSSKKSTAAQRAVETRE